MAGGVTFRTTRLVRQSPRVSPRTGQYAWGPVPRHTTRPAPLYTDAGRRELLDRMADIRHGGRLNMAPLLGSVLASSSPLAWEPLLGTMGAYGAAVYGLLGQTPGTVAPPREWQQTNVLEWLPEGIDWYEVTKREDGTVSVYHGHVWSYGGTPPQSTYMGLTQDPDGYPAQQIGITTAPGWVYDLYSDTFAEYWQQATISVMLRSRFRW